MDKTISMPFNLVGRQVHRFVYKIKQIPSSVYFKIDERMVNVKSLIGVFSANVERGQEVVISVFNDDSKQAETDIKEVEKIIKEMAVSEDGI